MDHGDFTHFTSNFSVLFQALLFLLKEPSQQLKADTMNIITTTTYLDNSSIQKTLFEDEAPLC